MEKDIVGYRFSPTGEELINYYLKNKILGKLWLVHKAINEINICAYDPECLPSLSKLDSSDLVWYFFSVREDYAPDKKKKGTKRTTPSGFWKVNGNPQEIRDKRGHGVEIGLKKMLVYRKGRSGYGEKTPWVMHEYHITSSPFNQSNYVICKVMYNYKGFDGDSSYGNNSNDLSHSTFVSVSNTARVINTTPEVDQPGDEYLSMSVDDLSSPLNEQYPHQQQQQQQIPWDDDYINEMLNFKEGKFDEVLGDLYITMQGHPNNHRPKEALTGIIDDYISESDDAESISVMSYQGTSSPDNAHNLSRHFHTSLDEMPFTPEETFINRKNQKSHLTRRTIPSKQEVKDDKSKAVDAFLDKKSSSSAMQRNRKNPRYIYLMNMIISFIILVTFISNILSVLLSVKT